MVVGNLSLVPVQLSNVLLAGRLRHLENLWQCEVQLEPKVECERYAVVLLLKPRKQLLCACEIEVRAVGGIEDLGMR